MSTIIGIKTKNGVFLASESMGYTVLNTNKLDVNSPIFTPKLAPNTSVAMLGDVNTSTMVRHIPDLLKEDKTIPVEERTITNQQMIKDGYLKILQETYKVKLLNKNDNFELLDSAMIASINDRMIAIDMSGLLFEGDIIITGDYDHNRHYDLATFNKIPQSDDPIYKILKFYWLRIQDNNGVAFPIVVKDCKKKEIKRYYLMDVYKYLSEYEGGNK